MFRGTVLISVALSALFLVVIQTAELSAYPWAKAEFDRNDEIMEYLDEQANSYSKYPIAAALKSKGKRDTLDETPRRICGVKLVKAVIKVCDGCVKAPGMVKVEGKRSSDRHIYQMIRKRDQSLTRLCCANPCTYDLIKANFCC